MTDAAPDKMKRSHGALWYVGWGFLLYVSSMLPVVALIEWAVNVGLMSQTMGEAIALVYWPLFLIINVFGIDSEFSAATEALQQLLRH